MRRAGSMLGQHIHPLKAVAPHHRHRITWCVAQPSTVPLVLAPSYDAGSNQHLRSVLEHMRSLPKPICMYVQTAMNGHGTGGEHAGAAYSRAQSSGSPSQAQNYMVCPSAFCGATGTCAVIYHAESGLHLRSVPEYMRSLPKSSCMYVQTAMNGHGIGGHAGAAYSPAQSRHSMSSMSHRAGQPCRANPAPSRYTLNRRRRR